MDKPLAGLIKTWRHWLHLPDPSPVLATLATVAANHLTGNPVWLMLVGPPGFGKSEAVCSISKLDNVRLVASLTEGALLSGVSQKDFGQKARGGILREIGEFGFIVLKDFGSMLSKADESRSQVLAAMREVYDGHWVRHVGTDGGQELLWQGKVAILAAATDVIDLDRHHSVMSTMGERFVILRMPPVEAEGQAWKALEMSGREPEMREVLATANKNFFAQLALKKEIVLTQAEKQQVVDLGVFTAQCRSGVERHPYTRKIEQRPEPEAPARLTAIFEKLFRGCRLIGMGSAESIGLLRQIALGSMPVIRHIALVAVRDQKVWLPTTELARGVNLPDVTLRRALEDLNALGVLTRDKVRARKGDSWQLSEWAEHYLINVMGKG